MVADILKGELASAVSACLSLATTDDDCRSLCAPSCFTCLPPPVTPVDSLQSSDGQVDKNVSFRFGIVYSELEVETRFTRRLITAVQGRADGQQEANQYAVNRT